MRTLATMAIACLFLGSLSAPAQAASPEDDILAGKVKCGEEWGWCSFGQDHEVTRHVWFGDRRELAGPITVEGWGVNCDESLFSDTDISGSTCYVSNPNAPVTPPIEPGPPGPGPGPTEPGPTEPGDGMNMGHTPDVDVSQNMSPAPGKGYLDIQVLDPELIERYPGAFKPTENDVDNGGAFRVSCQPSHMANDDPIVFPGQPGKGHHHTFFGNTGTDYASTSQSLKTTGNSTCQGGIANRSAYWAPSLIDTKSSGKPLVPATAIFYYKNGDERVPNGLVMIAGDHEGSPANVQDDTRMYYTCNPSRDGGSVAYFERTPYIPSCSGDLMLTVTFPSCWDGVNLDSDDHKSHLRYEQDGTCPTGYEHKIPDITGNIHYNVPDTDGFRLASDDYEGGHGGYSLHMDYMFAWDTEVLNAWQANCLDKTRDCHAGLLGDGRWLRE